MTVANENDMEPIPESEEADRQYGPFLYQDQDLFEHLKRLGHDVCAVAPTCVGVSFSVAEQGVTFTVLSTHATSALLDAIQYTDDGPCETAIAVGSTVEFCADDVLNEDRWSMFARVSAAHGVASTLSLPVVMDDVAVAGFNLYGARTDTFEGLHQELADELGAWAPGAIADADLSLASIQLARRAPEILRATTRLAVAAALLSRVKGLTVDAAEDRLRAAAVRAAVPLPSLVDTMIEILGDPPA